MFMRFIALAFMSIFLSVAAHAENKTQQWITSHTASDGTIKTGHKKKDKNDDDKGKHHKKKDKDKDDDKDKRKKKR